MTFYQELQLNQAGSKNLLKKSETTKEKMYRKPSGSIRCSLVPVATQVRPIFPVFDGISGS